MAHCVYKEQAGMIWPQICSPLPLCENVWFPWLQLYFPSPGWTLHAPLAPQPSSPLSVITVMSCIVVVVFYLSSLNSDLTVFFSLSKRCIPSVCMHLVHSHLSSHTYLSSSARLYQGLGKLCPLAAVLSFRYLHDCLNSEQFMCLGYQT